MYAGRQYSSPTDHISRLPTQMTQAAGEGETVRNTDTYNGTDNVQRMVFLARVPVALNMVPSWSRTHSIGSPCLPSPCPKDSSLVIDVVSRGMYLKQCQIATRV